MSKSNAKPGAGVVARPLLAGMIAAAGAGAALPAAADTYLWLQEIPGEVTVKGFEKWIEVLSYTQTFRNTPAGTTGGVRVTCGDVTILKSIDKSSPKLIEAVVTGKFFRDAKLAFTKSSQFGTTEYYLVTLTDVQFASIEQTDQPDEAAIVERLSLRASAFEYEYTPTDAKGGTTTPIKFSYDCKAPPKQ